MGFAHKYLSFPKSLPLSSLLQFWLCLQTICSWDSSSNSLFFFFFLGGEACCCLGFLLCFFYLFVYQLKNSGFVELAFKLGFFSCYRRKCTYCYDICSYSNTKDKILHWLQLNVNIYISRNWPEVEGNVLHYNLGERQY